MFDLCEVVKANKFLFEIVVNLRKYNYSLNYYIELLYNYSLNYSLKK